MKRVKVVYFGKSGHLTRSCEHNAFIVVIMSRLNGSVIINALKQNCRNMRTISHTPFEKKDYSNYQSITNESDREFYCNMIALQKKLIKRLNHEVSLSEQK